MATDEDEDEEEGKEEEDETEEEFFSDHTRSMRLACCSCEQRMIRLLPHILHQQQQQDGKNSSIRISNQEKQKTQYYWTSILHELDEIRYQSYNEFWDSNKTAKTTTTTTTTTTTSGATTTVTDFPEMHIQDYNISNINAQEFRDTYHNRNIPCLINGLDKTCFEYLDKEWRQRKEQQQNSSLSRYDWFLEHVGPKTLVPLRYNSIIDINNNNNNSTSTTTPSPSTILDEDGRAIECQTRHVTMEEWLQIIKNEDDDDDDDDNDGDDGDDNKNKNKSNTVYYLKDWHLQLLLEQQQNKQKQLGDDPFINQNNNNKLYEVPDIFQYDLLNNFLLQFTKGDYRFCYFGPRNSTTQQHSDVMHSFSWSYNVVGTKQWTFYYNNKNKNMNDDKNDDDNNHIRFIQRAGQAVFVPSQWQHSVVNLEETISINHNWITTANVDLIWDCIKMETIAIHKELVSWQLHENFESCESMLLGCVGLDITAFLLMIWIRLLDILLLLEFDDTYNTVVSSFDDDNRDNNKVDGEKNNWGEEIQQQLSSSSWWDICRLSATLYVVINDDSIHVRERLDAVLKDKGMATKFLDNINVVLDFVVQKKTYNAM